MSTEALDLDQAVERFMAVEEPVVEQAEEQVEEVENSETVDEAEEVTEEVDSEVDDSEESEYDTEDDSAEDEDEPEPSVPDTITVKVDGEEVAVTLEDLKRSYSGQGKIQRGMQEAAEARKQAEQQKQQLDAAMQELSQMYQRIQQTGFKTPPVEPDQSSFDTDPIGYMEAKMKYDNELKEFTAEQTRMQQMQAYQQRQMQEAQQAMIQAEAEKLRQVIPELSDPKRAPQFKADLVKYGSEYGFTQEELGGMVDSRAFQVLADAMKWRKSQTNRKAAEKKVEASRKVIKPKAKLKTDPKVKKQRDTQSKLKKTGSIDDALSLILNS